MNAFQKNQDLKDLETSATEHPAMQALAKLTNIEQQVSTEPALDVFVMSGQRRKQSIVCEMLLVCGNHLLGRVTMHM